MIALRNYSFLLIVFSFAIAHAAPVGFERFYTDEPTSEGGALLYSELGCANCHTVPSVVEIPRRGPNLVDLKIRIDYDWVIEFLSDPKSAHPTTGMPSMTHGLAKDDIKAIAAYLQSLGKAKPLRPGRHTNAERGSSLYHEKGCVACHASTPDYRNPHGSGVTPFAIGFPDLKKKYSPTSLDHFLQQTQKYRPDGRMPHFGLEKQDSLDIAAHLVDFQHSDPRESHTVAKSWPNANPELAKRGKEMVINLNCAACHELPGIKPKAKVPLQSWADDKSPCLSTSSKKSIPNYDLSASETNSIKAYLESQLKPDPKQKTHLTLAAMNCYACHDRDGIGGPTPETNHYFSGDESLGDSGRLPPPLTGIGNKLQDEWLLGILSGAKNKRVRPYLKTEMPSYQNHAKELANLLTASDRKPDSKLPELSDAELEAGRKLLGTNGGVNCVTCHNWADKRSPGIPGPDLSQMAKRLRPNWFHDYLINPPSYRPGTLMPSLWPGGKSVLPGVLDGDTDRQIAAIWGFIKHGKGFPEGYPDHVSGQFELIPEDRPIIQRTFLNHTGTKAILVGFPSEIHIAYDGSNGQPSLVWKGRFFDAYDTWYTRAAPFGDPLSSEVYQFPPTTQKARYLGYQTDKDGNPTFLSQTESGQLINDSYSVSKGKLIRKVSWKKGNAPEVSHPEKANIKTSSTDNSITFVYSWK